MIQSVDLRLSYQDAANIKKVYKYFPGEDVIRIILSFKDSCPYDRDLPRFVFRTLNGEKWFLVSQDYIDKHGEPSYSFGP